jgi:hypothetical protein
VVTVGCAPDGMPVPCPEREHVPVGQIRGLCAWQSAPLNCRMVYGVP